MIGLPWIQVEQQVSMSFLIRVAVPRLMSRCSGTSICTICYTKKLLRPMALEATAEQVKVDVTGPDESVANMFA